MNSNSDSNSKSRDLLKGNDWQAAISTVTMNWSEVDGSVVLLSVLELLAILNGYKTVSNTAVVQLVEQLQRNTKKTRGFFVSDVIAVVDATME